MSKETKYKGVVIEATPEPETALAPAVGSSRIPLLLTLLIIIAISAAALYALPYWQKLQQDLSNLQQQASNAATVQRDLKTELAKTIELTKQHQAIMNQQVEIAEQQMGFIKKQEAAFSQQDQRIADAQHNMTQSALALNLAIEDVRKLAGEPDSRWMVAEAEYLLQVANSRLSLAHDPATAKKALQQADQRLTATGESRWNDVRAQIARDITNLDRVTLPAIEPISQHLDDLVAQVPGLMLANRTMKPTEKTSSDLEAQSKEPSWKNLMDSVLEGAKETVRIRRNDQPVEALIAPEQTALLYQNLELILESARLSLLQRDDVLFKKSLQRASQWLQIQFDQNDPATHSIQNTLAKLSSIELVPSLPDISRSLKYLRTEQATESSSL